MVAEVGLGETVESAMPVGVGFGMLLVDPPLERKNATKSRARNVNDTATIK